MGSYVIRFRKNEDVDDYKRAGKKAKHGLAMIMDGLERGDKDMIVEGAEKAWKGVKTMCEISDEMEEQYSERRNDRMDERNYNRRSDYRHDGDWNERDDEWMERRMRDSRGRFM